MSTVPRYVRLPRQAATDPPPCSPAWLATPLGQRLLACERAAVAAALESVFGDRLVQVGSWGTATEFLQYARTQMAVLLGDDDAVSINMVALAEQLPLASDSVDAVLLPHTLEQTLSPQRVLDEAHRVLRPGGFLLVLGIGGLGPFAWRRLLTGGRFPPDCRRLLSERKVLRRLDALGCSVVLQQRMLFAWPSQSARVSGLWQQTWDAWCRRWLPQSWAGAYLLAARKRAVQAAVRIRPRQPQLRAVRGVAKPVGPSARLKT